MSGVLRMVQDDFLVGDASMFSMRARGLIAGFLPLASQTFLTGKKTVRAFIESKTE